MRAPLSLYLSLSVKKVQVICFGRVTFESSALWPLVTSGNYSFPAYLSPFPEIRERDLRVKIFAFKFIHALWGFLAVWRRNGGGWWGSAIECVSGIRSLLRKSINYQISGDLLTAG